MIWHVVMKRDCLFSSLGNRFGPALGRDGHGLVRQRDACDLNVLLGVRDGDGRVVVGDLYRAHVLRVLQRCHGVSEALLDL